MTKYTKHEYVLKVTAKITRFTTKKTASQKHKERYCRSTARAAKTQFRALAFFSWSE